MIRHRRGPIVQESEESSDEEDAFSALSKKASSNKEDSKKIQEEEKQKSKLQQKNKKLGNTPTVQLPASTTSSMKRHHVASNESRKAKMDALLLELEAENTRKRPNGPPQQQEPGNNDPRRRGFVPEKKGSFVDPGEEHLTTNIFVGNLAPSITEEQLSDLFRQFGDLYSVKIMWPRTAEERARNRNTGFVCFMNREDAEEAMQECSECDPFQVGKRLMMRWGKNVKKTIKRGTGGVSITNKSSSNSSIIKKRAVQSQLPSSPDRQCSSRNNNDDNKGSSGTTIAEPGAKRMRLLSEASSVGGETHSVECAAVTTTTTDTTPISTAAAASRITVAAVLYDSTIHEKDAIRVVIPKSPLRARFISMIASFIAKDGSNLERRLIEIESRNPDFDFLIWNKTPNKIMDSNETNYSLPVSDDQRKQEHIFYKWRVYSFCQGDGMNTWRTEPFVMVHPNGRFWIPPMIDKEAAWKEEEEKRIREDKIKQKQKRRRLRQIASMKQISTGRQLEHQQQQQGTIAAGSAADGGAILNDKELDQFHNLVKKKLCASRSAICEAMAFCFEKSAAAKQISDLLKDALLESSGPRITVETRIARLYLLSDVLFNSQQPGVRNAFLYRTAIENMAPDVFASLGKHGSSATADDGSGKSNEIVVIGRLSMKKLSTAVSSVLGAWTNWSVYNPMFLDELQARFEGKEIKQEESNKDSSDNDKSDEFDEAEEEKDAQAGTVRIISDKKLGDWTEVNDQDEEELQPDYGSEGDDTSTDNGSSNSKHAEKDDRKEFNNDSREGKQVQNDKESDEDSGKRLKNSKDNKIDGKPTDNTDVDGEALDAEVDGEALDADVDGEPLGEGSDGESLIDEDLDGEPLSDSDLLEEVYMDVDGEPLDISNVDGDPLLKEVPCV